ncbi:MAG: hypothetical protein LBR88_07495 [Zoogloeaceae bacterium]|jgi:hypothetical protein|nr:hypothetical protein [Zoogloeaceae bacterium]
MARFFAAWSCLLGGFLLCTGAAAFSPGDLSFSFSGARIRHASFAADDLSLDWQGEGGAITVGRLELMGQEWKRLSFFCARLSTEPGAFRCEGGRLGLPGLAKPAALTLIQQKNTWRLELRPVAGEQWTVVWQTSGQAHVEAKNGRMATLMALLPPLAGLQSMKTVGGLNGVLDFHPDTGFKASFVLKDGGYASADGLQAAENMGLTLTLSGQPRAGGHWQTRGALAWTEGALYSDPLFLKSGGQRLEFSGLLHAGGWQLETASLHWPEVGEVKARFSGDWNGIREGQLFADALALAPLGEGLLRPFLAGRDLPDVVLSGRIGMELGWQGGKLNRVELRPENSGFNLGNGRFVLEGQTGRLHWNADAPGESELQVERMALGRLESGAFTLPLALWPQGFALKSPLHIPLLDGALEINHLEAGLDAEGQWEGALGLSVQPMSLEQLTPALDLPVMRGMLSANLPLIRFSNQEATLEGALVIQVFDGYLNCRDLRLIDPFGVRPRILANVDIQHLDLQQLTQTFSFGEITGFIDARVSGLELAAWQPLRFDARIESSPGRYPRRISQRAVDNITSLSGGGMMASLQASVLRLFEDFGYRRIGIGCRLESGVCEMSGIAGLDKGGRYALVEGGGIPALTVMGYNRAVDWEELIARIAAATDAPEPVIE